MAMLFTGFLRSWTTISVRSSFRRSLLRRSASARAHRLALGRVEAATPDHQAQAVRDQLQKTGVVVREAPRLTGADMENPEDTSMVPDRDTEE